MRQGQQNRRGRGRPRKPGQHQHHNPMMRTYQSNGPDQKIHGTPTQIAEKYISLARDAHSSGDPVLAENYLQHAEHYNRIILGFREQQMQQGGEGTNGGSGRTQGGESYDGDDADDDGEDESLDFGPPQMRAEQPVRGNEPQPQARGFDQQSSPRGDDRGQRQQNDRYRDTGRDTGRDSGNRDGGRDSGNRDGNRPFRQRGFGQDRGDRPERQGRGERVSRPAQNDRPERTERAPRPERNDSFGNVERERPIDRPLIDEPPVATEVQPAPAPRRRERFVDEPPHEQPEFLRRPVRRSRKDVAAAEPAAESNVAPTTIDDPGSKR